MPEPKRPLKVFLCHAHTDRDSVRGLYARLTKDGVDAWLDKTKLLPGQDWELEIRKAVRESDVVVVCLSRQFNQAGFRQKEVRLALDTAMEQPEGEIFIIPARLEECDTLESLRKWHWVDLFEEDGYEMLMRALQARADRIRVSLQVKKTSQSFQLGAVKASSPKNNIRMFIAVGVIAAAIIWIFLLLGQLAMKSSIATIEKSTQTFVAEQNATAQQQMIATVVFLATQTAVPASTSTDVIAPIKTSLPTEITDAKGVSMVLVPAGEFTMGSDAGDPDEKPVHQVYLDTFYIDKYEVTNELYKICEDSKVCQPPSNISSLRYREYYGNSEFDNYPVVYIEWKMAKTYCEWRKANLPSEAEWEKSARGTDNRIYPWGNKPDVTYANYLSGQERRFGGDITEIGNYKMGRSPYNAYDMAGNVWEWVADLYEIDYYESLVENAFNPIGPSSGNEHVIRGGAFDSYLISIRSSNRKSSNPFNINYDIGFRCAKDAP